MYSDKQRVATYLQTSIKEIELVEQMSAPIHEPNDFGIELRCEMVGVIAIYR